MFLPLGEKERKTDSSIIEVPGGIEIFGAEEMRGGDGVILGESSKNLITFGRPEKEGILVIVSGEIGELGEIGTTEEIVVKGKNVETVVGFKRSSGDDEGNGGAIWADGSVLGLVVGQRSSRGNGGEEASRSDGDKFFFDGNVFFPGVEAGFGNFDLVGTGSEIEGVVSSSGKTTVDENLGLLRMRRGGQEASTVKILVL